METEKHYNLKSGWIRAAVLGANDGILSTSSLAVGVAAAGSLRQPVVLAALAGIVAGALSMAAGEYVSVSSQADIETADLEREKMELATMPEAELAELAEIYRQRGLDKALSLEVARQLTAHNALEAHARDELGINEITQAKPMQAAFASCLSFISGGMLPLAVSFLAPMEYMVMSQYVFAIAFMALSAFVAARAGGSSVGKAVARICFWGTVAMGVTALVGFLFGTQVG